jgi:hypothetical protein
MGGDVGARRWLAIVLALTFLAGPVSTVGAQYAGALPAGVVAAEVDGQPIDADNTPETDDPSPQISGRINTGLPSVDLAIGDGEVVRFTAPVDERGRFRATPPEPLEPGQYSLYIFDALVGAFTVSAAAEDDRNAGAGEGRAETPDLDIARVVPFPFDFGEAIPGLGLLDGRFFSLDEEARRSAVGGRGRLGRRNRREPAQPPGERLAGSVRVPACGALARRPGAVLRPGQLVRHPLRHVRERGGRVRGVDRVGGGDYRICYRRRVGGGRPFRHNPRYRSPISGSSP